MEPTIQMFMLTYVLELENGYYYVGKTTNLNLRLAQHWIGNKGALWTRLHKPKKIIRVFLGDVEREKTVLMMKTHGWQNVRGANWCKVKMTNLPSCLRSFLLD